jgi:hypothetical protein
VAKGQLLQLKMSGRGIARRRRLYGLINTSDIFVFHAIFTEKQKAPTILILLKILILKFMGPSSVRIF